MKKHLLTSILFFAFFSLTKAQEYQPFLSETGTYWRHAWTSYFSLDHGWYQYAITGDTTINDVVYSQLWYTSESNLIDSGYTTYQHWYDGAFRNDIPNKKVYYFGKNAVEEVLWYDFDLQLGDTVEIRDEQIFFVSDIDSLLLGDGKYHKRFIISVKNCEIHPEDQPFSSLIEGIGSREGLFRGFYCMIDSGDNHLECVANENYSIYGGFCRPIEMSVPEFEKEQAAHLYPNPAQTSFTIDFAIDDQFLQIDIFNLQGQCVKIVSASQSRQPIDVADLSNGIYFVRFVSKGEKLYKKLIIIK